MLTPPRSLWIPLALGLGCAPGDDPRPAAQRTTTRVGAPDDAAAEGPDDASEIAGTPCAAGDDCAPLSPALLGEETRCAAVLSGCPCAADAPPVACDVDTDAPVTPRTCYVGQRGCEGGRWGPCRAYGERFR